jgi:hypothetical protein
MRLFPRLSVEIAVAVALREYPERLESLAERAAVVLSKEIL